MGAFGEGSHCKAFPPEKDKFIPPEIIRGLHDHRKPFEGDNGIRYESNGDYDDFNDEGDTEIPKDIDV